MDINLSKFQDMVRDREAWHAAIHGVTKSRTQLINWPLMGISQGPPKTEFLPQASPSRTQQHPLLSRLHLALPGNLPDWHLSQPSRATSGQKETYFFVPFTLGSGNHPIYSNFFSLLSQWSKAANGLLPFDDSHINLSGHIVKFTGGPLKTFSLSLRSKKNVPPFQIKTSSNLYSTLYILDAERILVSK